MRHAACGMWGHGRTMTHIDILKQRIGCILKLHDHASQHTHRLLDIEQTKRHWPIRTKDLPGAHQRQKTWWRTNHSRETTASRGQVRSGNGNSTGMGA